MQTARRFSAADLRSAVAKEGGVNPMLDLCGDNSAIL